MAVENTGAMYKAFTFDGESSRNYGVYITGEAVYNAPERDIEMVSIPGRNGSYALDRGRFQNIEVTYPAGIFASTESDFADAVSDFRNMLCSRTGYCRLVDEYNPNEYRLAIYKSGLEVTPTACKAGEFEITFECKPQRYLTSGESAVAVADGGTITNPTLFASNPVLQVTGYGDLNVNGYDINIANAMMGTVEVGASSSNESTSSASLTTNLNTNIYNSGDTITVGAVNVKGILLINTSTPSMISAVSVSSHSGDGTGTYKTMQGDKQLHCYVNYNAFSVASNTTSNKSDTYVLSVTVKKLDNSTYTGTVTITSAVAYSGNTVTRTASVSMSAGLSSYLSIYSCTLTSQTTYADSTVSILGTPMYIDCDLGEAYKIENNSVVDLNSYVDLGSDLPKLSPGSNAVTYDNTITDFKIVPNWWQL